MNLFDGGYPMRDDTHEPIETEQERFRAALEWFGEDSNWTVFHDEDGQRVISWDPIDGDRTMPWAIARDALSGQEGPSEKQRQAMSLLRRFSNQGEQHGGG